MLFKQFNFGSLLLLITATFLDTVLCDPRMLTDCPNTIISLPGYASIGLIKYTGATGTRFQFFTSGFQKNHNICLYSDNKPITGDFYNTVWDFEDSKGPYSLRVGNTDNRTYLYYSWDVFHFSCDATDSAFVEEKVIFNYGGKSEVVEPISYICKANNGFEKKKKRSVVEKKKKRSVVEKKMQSRSRLITLDQTAA